MVIFNSCVKLPEGISLPCSLSPLLICQNGQGGDGLQLCSFHRWQRIGTTSPLALAPIKTVPTLDLQSTLMVQSNKRS